MSQMRSSPRSGIDPRAGHDVLDEFFAADVVSQSRDCEVFVCEQELAAQREAEHGFRFANAAERSPLCFASGMGGVQSRRDRSEAQSRTARPEGRRPMIRINAIPNSTAAKAYYQ